MGNSLPSRTAHISPLVKLPQQTKCDGISPVYDREQNIRCPSSQGESDWNFFYKLIILNANESATANDREQKTNFKKREEFLTKWQWSQILRDDKNPTMFTMMLQETTC